MTIRYPNGKKFEQKRILSRKKNVNIKDERFSNRGMSLEDDINASNEYYRTHNIAVIHKKPTPLQIVNVDYPSRSGAVVTEAYFKKPSTTDYNGIYKGHYIDFEAKETKNKTSFPLKNFHEHQIQHMRDIIHHKGIAFVLLRFTLLDEVYFVKAEDLVAFYDNQDRKRKSIPKKDIETFGVQISLGFQPRLDYLKVVDRFLQIT